MIIVDRVLEARAAEGRPVRIALTRDITRDTPITLADLTMPETRLVDRLRRDQDSHFPV